MKFIIEREQLLKPLQQVSSPLGGRPTLPILGNLLLKVSDGVLHLTGTDLEMEMMAAVPLDQPHENGETTVPAEVLDIWRVCRTARKSVLSLTVTVFWSAPGAAASRCPLYRPRISRIWMTGRVMSLSLCRRQH